MTFSHRFHPTILRAYDIRGVVGDTLHEADAYAVGRAVGAVMRARGGRRAALGWDGRASSPALADSVSDGLRDCGVDCVQIGLGPTPMLYYACHELDVDAGIQVTGSHNPPTHNGFKIIIENVALSGDAIHELGRLAEKGIVTAGEGIVEHAEVARNYVARLVRDIVPPAEITCVWDPGNGAVARVLGDVLARLPGTHHTLNDVVDGSFPAHHPDPGNPDNMRDLQSAVTATSADVGFAFDGDGDRLGVVDSRGRIVWPDQFLILLARAVLERVPNGTVIADVKASRVLFDEIEQSGGRSEMWKTGHSLIKARMRETGAPLAGEMSGHVFFGERWYGFDDGLYAALRLLDVLRESDLNLATFLDSLPAVTATPEIRFHCPDEAKFGLVQRVQKHIRESGSDYSDVDGIRVTTDDGWWLLRASNTEPALVARLEATDENAMARLKEALTTQLLTAGLPDDSVSPLEKA